MNPYIQDILDQPAALRAALDSYPARKIEPLRTRWQNGEFDRIVLTGMGSSHSAAYPAWLELLSLPLPTIFISTAELLHYGQAMLGPRTLLWINSQSGRSIEILRLLEAVQDHRPAFQLSMTNDLESPLADSANLAVPISAGAEATVSTKTFINMQASLSLAARQITGGNWRGLRDNLRSAADGMEAYLQNWQEQTSQLETMLGSPDQLLILGRGASMAAVWNGSLINKEAGKSAFEGMNVADFRHGPFELVSPRLTLLVLEGSSATARLNRELALEVTRLGGRAIWVASRPDPELPTLLLPACHEAARPLVEILPLQMLTLVMAQRNGVEPGKFRHIEKITSAE